MFFLSCEQTFKSQAKIFCEQEFLFKSSDCQWLFCEAIKISDYTLSIFRWLVDDDLKKNIEESASGPIDLLTHRLPGDIESKHVKFQKRHI
jgi:hypothetical protein